MDWLLSLVVPICLFFGTCDAPAPPVRVPPHVLRLGDCARLDGNLFACRRTTANPLDPRDGR